MAMINKSKQGKIVPDERKCVYKQKLLVWSSLVEMIKKQNTKKISVKHLQHRLVLISWLVVFKCSQIIFVGSSACTTINGTLCLSGSSVPRFGRNLNTFGCKQRPKHLVDRR
jgi:hypothetical protein